MSVLPIGGEPPRPPASKRVRRALLAILEKFEEAADRTRRLADPEAIHDLRVAIRRLSAALSLWRGTLREPPRRKAVRRLRRLRRALGAARELEVHVADLEPRSGVQSFVLRLQLAEWVGGLRREMERARHHAATHVSARRIRRIVRPVKRAARTLAGDATAATLPAADERLAIVAAKAREAMIVAATLGDDESLHAARVATKKWRYSIEAADAAEARDAKPHAGPAVLRDVQRALGEVQDRATLRQRLVAYATQLREQNLGAQAASLGPLIAEIDGERRTAVETFLRLTPVLTEPPSDPVRILPDST